MADRNLRKTKHIFRPSLKNRIFDFAYRSFAAFSATFVGIGTVSILYLTYTTYKAVVPKNKELKKLHDEAILEKEQIENAAKANNRKLFTKMSEAIDMIALKRILPIDAFDEETANKKVKLTDRRKMSALLMMYSGVGYLGMQRNQSCKTIEKELLDALMAADIITQQEAESPGKIRFQRASKTDKNVSAAGQVCSLKLPINDSQLVSKINAKLPQQLRVIDVIRATQSFNAKGYCTHRKYQYLTPTFAFSPKDTPDRQLTSFRMSAENLTRLNSLLQIYKGTHNYHNFTSGRKPNDPSCNRYMIDLGCDPPFLHKETEYVLINIQGQSFMLHQIRKMIGLTMAVCRGYCDERVFQLAFESKDKVDIPKAPGLGLLLNKVFFSGYNNRYGSDGVHTSIDLERYEDVITAFKHEHIFPYMFKTEEEEQSMILWLETLGLHSYSYRFSGDNRPPLSKSTKEEEAPVSPKPELTSSSDAPLATVDIPAAPLSSDLELVRDVKLEVKLEASQASNSV